MSITAERDTAEANLERLQTKFEAVTAENGRLTAALKTANKNHEKFEREWYLRGDKIERLTAVLEPFAHPDFCEVLGGNTNGDKSIVFQRQNAQLTIGDFRIAREAWNNVRKG